MSAKLFPFLASWIGSLSFVWFLFSKLEDTLSLDTKSKILDSLKQKSQHENNWPQQFSEIFDSIFGEKHLSWRCFIRSCIASSFFSIIMFFLWLSIHPADVGRHLHFGIAYSALWAIISLIFLNFVPDYISLLETRFLLKIMTQVKTAKILFLLLIVDLLLTFLIWILGFAIFLKVGQPIHYLISQSSYAHLVEWVVFPDLKLLPKLAMDAFLFRETIEESFRISVLSIYLYTTFFTSIWLWLYIFSKYIHKFLFIAKTKTSNLLTHFRIDLYPLKSLGIIAMIPVTIFYVLFALLK
jgi:hypothetical protein